MWQCSWRLLVCNKQKLQCAWLPVSLAINQPTDKKVDAYWKKEVIGGLRQSWWSLYFFKFITGLCFTTLQNLYSGMRWDKLKSITICIDLLLFHNSKQMYVWSPLATFEIIYFSCSINSWIYNWLAKSIKHDLSLIHIWRCRRAI